MWTSWLFLALFVTVQGRAVNISNTWVLPEEGFPVFYRYFRDRISWYEADAVCQFHHANLVTVDTTAQYDAVRAYLKELDITSAVWVGLIRSNPDGDFTWTDYRGLGGEGYWSSAPDSRTAPLCAAADPSADYRWDARACGGPSVASFICELPVPQWALGNEGCMVKALPALTILYLPESAAVQLTADCGLAGVRPVQCTGNIKREDLLKDLKCSEEDQTSTIGNIHNTSDNWQATTDTLLLDQDNIETMTDENITTEHSDLEQDSNTKLTTVYDFILGDRNQLKAKQYEPNPSYEKVANLNLIENNNLYNTIPNVPNTFFKDDLSSTEYADKLEEERHFQHKLLHDELARLGNFETIFNQPTDHFVPPLVMAKAKLSNDMNAMSWEEKLAQEHEGFQNMKQSNKILKFVKNENENITESPNRSTTDNVLISALHSTTYDNKDKEINKKITPKKYSHKDTKYLSTKRKIIPVLNKKEILNDDVFFTSTPLTTVKSTTITSDDRINIAKRKDNDEKDETSIELTVIIREPSELADEFVTDNYNATLSKNEETSLKSFLNTSELNNNGNEHVTVVTRTNIIELNDEIINITFNMNYINVSSFESNITDNLNVSTIMPIFKDDEKSDKNITLNSYHNLHKKLSDRLDLNDFVITSSENTLQDNDSIVDDNAHSHEPEGTFLLSDMFAVNGTQDLTPNISINDNITLVTSPSEKQDINEDEQFNTNSNEEEIDDFQSPLLSGADEPIHKPMRSRRPQVTPNKGKKFNPFRILG